MLFCLFCGSICCSTADSVEDAEKWMTGLELLRQETLAAHTPEIIERYTHARTHARTHTPRCLSVDHNTNQVFLSFSVFPSTVVGWGSRCTRLIKQRKTGSLLCLSPSSQPVFLFSVSPHYCSFSVSHSITLKELKSLLPQMNVSVPGGRFLEDRFAVQIILKRWILYLHSCILQKRVLHYPLFFY